MLAIEATDVRSYVHDLAETVMAKRKTAKAKKKSPRKAPLARKKRSIVRKKVFRRGRESAKLGLKLLWTPTPEAQNVIDTTQDVFDNTPGAKSDCNKFVKAVCASLLTDPFKAGASADDITNNIRDSAWRGANNWIGLDKDPDAAKKAADKGDLVIGGATSTDLGQNHGHVVVVVSCEKLWKGFGYASWGTLGGTGKVNEKMTLAYKLTDLPSVSYMSKPT